MVISSTAHQNNYNKLTVMRSFRRRTWIDYGLFDNSSEFESDAEQVCEMLARWRPEEASRPIVDEAPVFYPTEEEFKDPLKYIESIYEKVEGFGICRIVPPSSFKPPCPLKDRNFWKNCKFETRTQEVEKLQNREPARKKPKTRRRRKRRQSWTIFARRHNNSCRTEVNEPAASDEDDRFGFHPGPEYTLEAFQKYADEFKDQYFGLKDVSEDLCAGDDKSKLKMELSVEDIEGEYWRLVENSSEEVEVHYGADLDTEKFGSGFPKATLACQTDSDRYVTSGWNLNNFARLQGSVLAFEEADISGVLVPWLYIGMCFSSFCWHVEDHHLYSLNYHHWGDPKLWYGVPASDALKLEVAMKKHLPYLFEEQPSLLNELVTQMSPSVLKSEGVSVYRTVQRAGEFVLTFPRAYHSGFNCGFNCAEAVNVAPVDWLPHGQNAVELYHEQCRKTSISHDKLLMGAANEAIKTVWELLLLNKSKNEGSRWATACGKDGILTTSIKRRVSMEKRRRGSLPKLFEARRMPKDFDLTDEKECFLCFYDLFLSACGCECSPNRYSCLEHAELLCSCDPSKRYFLFRYDLDELGTLVEALEGNTRAVYDWATEKLLIVDASVQAPEKSDNLQREPLPDCCKDLILVKTKNVNLTVVPQKIFGKLESEVGVDSTSILKTNKRDLDKMPIDINPSATNGHPLEVEEDRKSNSCTFPSKEGIPSEKHLDIVLDMNKPCNSENRGFVTPEDSHSNLKDNSRFVLSREVDIVNSVEEPSTAESVKHFEDGPVQREVSVGNLPSLKDGNNVVENNDIMVGVCKMSFDFDREGAVLKRKRCSLDESCISGQEDAHCGQRKCRMQSSSGSSSERQRSVETFRGSSEQNLVYKDIDLNSSSSICLCGHGSGASDMEVVKTLREMPAEENPHHDTTDMDGSEKDKLCTKSVCVRANKSSLTADANLQTTLPIKVKKLFGVNLQPMQSFSYQSQNINTKESCSCMYSVKNENMSKSSLAVHPSGGASNLALDIQKMLHAPGCDVMPLNFGTVVPRKPWYCSDAIFPKGYRSRVNYCSIVDPRQICGYISEVFDAGLLGPMFKVSMEDHPTEVFVNTSPGKCWEMVRERLNEEIRDEHYLGKLNLSPTQPPGSLDGFKMFGFSSLHVIESIEALDPSHQCSDYWMSKSRRPSTSKKWNLNNIPDEQTECCRNTNSCHAYDYDLNQESSRDQIERVLERSMVSQGETLIVEDEISPVNVRHVLRGLFEKGSREELTMMHKILCNQSWSSNWRFALTSLLEEIQDLWRDPINK